jgi:hypothetical protein
VISHQRRPAMNIPIRNLITMLPPKVQQQVINAAW